jgi:hypothetical protein
LQLAALTSPGGLLLLDFVDYRAFARLELENWLKLDHPTNLNLTTAARLITDAGLLVHQLARKGRSVCMLATHCAT